MREGEVRLGATVEVGNGERRRGRVTAGPFYRHYGKERKKVEVWRITFPSGHKSDLTARELRHPDPITRLADLA